LLIARSITAPIISRHRPRKRAIQYCTGGRDRAGKPRRTGSSAFADDDSRGVMDLNFKQLQIRFRDLAA
jgi:hypothetical protein